MEPEVPLRNLLWRFELWLIPSIGIILQTGSDEIGTETFESRVLHCEELSSLKSEVSEFSSGQSLRKLMVGLKSKGLKVKKSYFRRGASGHSIKGASKESVSDSSGKASE